MKNKLPPPHLIPVQDIPKADDVPLDNLIDVFRVCTQLEKICTDNDGIGLSAVQVGIPWKLFIVLHTNRKEECFYQYFINCEYEGLGNKKKSIEGCLSLRKVEGGLRRFEVDRFEKVRVHGKELVINEKPEIIGIDKELDGLYAIVYQHEIDHALNILISDIGKEIELF